MGMRTTICGRFSSPASGRCSCLSGVRVERAGFTILELMIVVGIIGVIAATVGSALFAGIRVWESIRSFNEHRVDLAILLERFEADLRNVLPFKTVGFEGDAGQMTFAGLDTRTHMAAPSERRLAKIAFVFHADSHQIRRHEYSFPPRLMDEGKIEILMRGAESVKFSYASEIPAPAGTRAPAQVIWRDSWRKNDGMPARVKIEAEIKEESRTYNVERTVYIPARFPVSKEIKDETGYSLPASGFEL